MRTQVHVVLKNNKPHSVFHLLDWSNFMYGKSRFAIIQLVPKTEPIELRTNCEMKIKMIYLFVIFISLDDLYRRLALFF